MSRAKNWTRTPRKTSGTPKNATRCSLKTRGARKTDPSKAEAPPFPPPSALQPVFATPPPTSPLSEALSTGPKFLTSRRLSPVSFSIKRSYPDVDVFPPDLLGSCPDPLHSRPTQSRKRKRTPSKTISEVIRAAPDPPPGLLTPQSTPPEIQLSHPSSSLAGGKSKNANDSSGKLDDMVDNDDDDDASAIVDSIIQYGFQCAAEREREEEELFREEEEKRRRAETIHTSLPPGVGIGSACLMKTSRSEWRPARLVEFNPGTVPQDGRRRHEQGKEYWVEDEYAPGKRKKLSRSGIIFTVDNAIASCKREIVITRVEAIKNDADKRATTPKTGGPEFVPEPQEFCKLDQVEQLRLIRPTLLRIIKEEYPPAQDRIDMFYADDIDMLAKRANYGDLSEREICEVFVPELRRWAERKDRWLHMKARRRGREPARPKGSRAYESLSPERRTRFVLDVLCPEAAIAICIHSFGIDTEDEQKAYDAARKTLMELKAKNNEARWDEIKFMLNQARRVKRAELGMISEDLSGRALEDARGAEKARPYDERISNGVDLITKSGSTRRLVRYEE